MADEPQQHPEIRREIEIDALPEDVWEAIATEEGRERWLEDDPDRELWVESDGTPGRIVWWWSSDPAQEPRRVEVLVVGSRAGTRVIVTETAPPLSAPALLFPLPNLMAAFALAAA